VATEHTGNREPALAPHSPLPAPQWDEGVLDALYEAAFSQPGAEIVGVLVGASSQTSVAARIAAMIPASSARFPERAQLDHQAWAYIHASMARYYPGLEIVGWWMSRPGPNTELEQSELDAAGESFARPSQFGFVFDSHHRRAALYGWQQGTYVRMHEASVPRRLTRARDSGSKQLRPVVGAMGMGVAMGLIAWLASGKPGLSLAPLEASIAEKVPVY